MKTIQIKIKAFPYYADEHDDISGEDVRVEKLARRGDVIEVDQADYVRAMKHDAAVDFDPGAEPAEAEDQEPVDLDFGEATSAEIAEFMQSNKLSVKALMERIGDSEEIAQKVYDAEIDITGGEPRSTLLDELDQLIDLD